MKDLDTAAKRLGAALSISGAMLLFTVGACSSDPSDPDDGDTTGGTIPEDLGSSQQEVACAMDRKVGEFAVQLTNLYTSVSGAVADAVVPRSVLTLIDEADACQLLQQENYFCDPPCAPAETCDASGTCIPYPANQDVGKVTITGLAADVVMDPIPPSNTYFYGELPNPGFGEGDAIRLGATGSTVEAFGFDVLGVALMPQTPDAAVLTEGQDAVLTWAAGTVPASMLVSIDINLHGASPLTIICDGPDSGSLTIAAGLIDQMLAAGISGFPAAHLRRRSIASLEVAPLGCVEFSTSSQADRPIDIEGYTPCKNHTDCPEGQHCDIATESCVDD